MYDNLTTDVSVNQGIAKAKSITITLPAPAFQHDQKMLPCPFCGQKEAQNIQKLNLLHCYYATCHWCQMQSGYYKTEKACLTAWNTRNEPIENESDQKTFIPKSAIHMFVENA